MTKQKNNPTKGDKTRQKILEAAAVMMADKGPDAVSMREIAAKLTISKPVLYYYFKDKQALIRAVFIEGTKHFRELDKLIVKENMSLEKKIETILRNHLSFIKKNPNAPKCALKIIAAPEGGHLSELALEMKLETRKMLDIIIREAAAKGEIAQSAAKDMTRLVSAIIIHFLIEAKELGHQSLDTGLPARLSALICAGAKNIKLALFAVLLPVILTQTALAAPLALSLNGAVETALNNNATVAVAKKSSEIYKEKVSEYWGSVFPQIGLNAQYTRNIDSPSFFIGGQKIKAGLDNSYAASLDLNQVLWAGGKVNTGIRMAKLYAASGEEQLQTAQKNITRSVRQLYYAVLLSSAMAGIEQETLDLAKQHLATIEAQYKQGLASDLSVLRQKVEVSNNEPALTRAKNLYEEGLVELKSLLGLDPEAELTLTDELRCERIYPAATEELYKEALLKRPEYRTLKIQADLNHNIVTIEKAGHYPYFSAFATRQFQGQTASGFPDSAESAWSTAAGLRLSLPLFAGGSVTSRVSQAKLQASIAETQLKDLERKIKIEVKQARLWLLAAEERLDSQITSVETARKTMAATQLRFKNGLAGQLDLNDAALALNKAQTLYIQAQHDTCSSAIALNWTLGK